MVSPFSYFSSRISLLVSNQINYLWAGFDLRINLSSRGESVVRVMCDVGYLCANFCLPMPLCSRLRPDVRDRQMSDVRRESSLGLMPPPYGAGYYRNRRIFWTRLKKLRIYMLVTWPISKHPRLSKWPISHLSNPPKDLPFLSVH